MAQMKNISELNKLRVRLFIEAVLNEGRLELIDELIAADYVGRIPCAEPVVTGPAGVRQLVSSHRHAHPGLYVKIEDQIAEEDRVVTRWHATVPAPEAQPPLAGRTACCAGISITRLLAGKQVDSYTECTNLTASPALASPPITPKSEPPPTPLSSTGGSPIPARTTGSTSALTRSSPAARRHGR